MYITYYIILHYTIYIIKIIRETYNILSGIIICKIWDKMNKIEWLGNKKIKEDHGKIIPTSFS